MSLDLDIDLIKGNECNELAFIDQTIISGDHGTGLPFNVINDWPYGGYGSPGEINVNDITESSLVATPLGGTGQQTLFSGTDYFVSVHGYELIGISDSPLPTVGDAIQVLVNGVPIMPIIYANSANRVELAQQIADAINAYTSTPLNFTAFAFSAGLYIYTQDDTGENTNNLPVTVNVTGTASISPSNNALDGYGKGNARKYVMSNPLSDGVYDVVYTVTDGTQTAAVSMKFFNDCNIRACLIEKINRATKDSCGCCNGCGDGIDQEKVNWLFAELESAQAMFDEQLYDCAHDVLQKLGSQCNKLCQHC